MKHIFVLLQRSGFGFLNFLILLALCAVAAKWTWIFLAPASVALLKTPNRPAGQSAEAIIADHLLTSKTSLDHPQLNIKLVGVFATEGNHQGVAIFQGAAGGIMVALKRQVMPGIRLDAIYKDHVVLDRDGTKVRLNLEESAPPINLRDTPKNSVVPAKTGTRILDNEF